MSGLRDELAALVESPDDTQEWENEGWRGVRQVHVVDVARIRALLDRFPPEAASGHDSACEGVPCGCAARSHFGPPEAEGEAALVRARVEAVLSSERFTYRDQYSGPAISSDAAAAIRTAIAASPEEQDRG